MVNLNAGQMKEGRQEDDWNTQKKQNEGALFFSVSANKDVWACWLLIGEDSDNKELIPMKAHSESSLKLLKFETCSFVCLPHFSRFIFSLPSYLNLKDEYPV